ncbi:MAG: hypothetical protein LAT54_00975 [Cryomorphaceae bacterium]|nr:hypothetical protein [Cryomorphaceae bacterium]
MKNKLIVLATLPIAGIIVAIHYLIWPESFQPWPIFYPLVYGFMIFFVMLGLALTLYLHKKHPQLAAYALLGMNMFKMLTVLVMVLLAIYRFENVSLNWSYPLLFLYLMFLIYSTLASIRILKY